MATGTSTAATGLTATGQGGLASLAKRINKEHSSCEAAARDALDHAQNAGRLLIEAKSKCPHSTWLKWLAVNFSGSKRVAQVYMRIADGWPAIREKAQISAPLSIQEATKLLNSPTSSLTFGNALTPEETIRQCLEVFEAAEVELVEFKARQQAIDSIKQPTPHLLQRVKNLAREAGEMQNTLAEARLRMERAFVQLVNSLNEPELKLILAELSESEQSLVLQVISRKDAS